MFLRITAFSLLFLSLSSFVFAQTDTISRLQYPKSYFYYFKDSGREVADSNSADYTRTVVEDSLGKLFTVTEVNKNGKMRRKFTSLTRGFRYIKQGLYAEYFPNGSRKLELTYDNDDIVGERMLYYPNDKLYYTCHYDTAQKKFIVTEARDSTGNIIAEKGNGKWIEYRNDFKDIAGEGSIENGLKQGEWKGRLNDTVRYVCTYKQGESVSGTSYITSGKEVHFTKDEIEPEFNGGKDAFYKYLAKKVRYPFVAKENNVQGKVLLTFVIEKDGTVDQIKVVRGIGSGCDEMAVSVLKSSPPWKPGYLYGIAVPVNYTIPLTFSISIPPK